MENLVKKSCHCQYDFCGLLTFTPFECEHCQKSFCRNHRSASEHECLSVKAGKVTKKKKLISRSTRKCECCKKKFNYYLTIQCSKCMRVSCIEHRHHNCVPIEKPKKEEPPISVKNINCSVLISQMWTMWSKQTNPNVSSNMSYLIGDFTSWMKSKKQFSFLDKETIRSFAIQNLAEKIKFTPEQIQDRITSENASRSRLRSYQSCR